MTSKICSIFYFSRIAVLAVAWCYTCQNQINQHSYR